jgi:hypothetical protein
MLDKIRFQFGNVVVVKGVNIGVIVKSWGKGTLHGRSYDVYVRSFNGITTYREEDIQHYIYSKELTDEEREFYQT